MYTNYVIQNISFQIQKFFYGNRSSVKKLRAIYGQNLTLKAHKVQITQELNTLDSIIENKM